jgi:D-sedoheptulose 7-phosphate isomerase
MKLKIQESLALALTTLDQVIRTPGTIENIELAAQELAKTFKSGGKVIACGNGGSACDAMHFCEEFTGRYRKNRKPLPAISLTDPGYLTCTANDFGYDQVFARGVEAYGKPGDILVVLTTSGNSENIIKAVQKAKQLDLKTVALLGKDGGQLKGQCDIEWIIPGITADRIQEVHMTLLHIIIESTERIMFPELY